MKMLCHKFSDRDENKINNVMSGHEQKFRFPCHIVKSQTHRIFFQIFMFIFMLNAAVT